MRRLRFVARGSVNEHLKLTRVLHADSHSIHVDLCINEGGQPISNAALLHLLINRRQLGNTPRPVNIDK